MDQLERAGYVERVPDPDDARARLVKVAERGRRLGWGAVVRGSMVSLAGPTRRGRFADLRRSLEALARDH